MTIKNKIFFETKRVILSLKGDEVLSFLQNLITVDTEEMVRDAVRWSLLLNPQGRFLYEFFIIKKSETLVFIDIAQIEAENFIAVLKMYMLRLKIEIANEPLLSYQYLDDSIKSRAIFQQFDNLDIQYYKDPSFSLETNSSSSFANSNLSCAKSRQQTISDLTNKYSVKTSMAENNDQEINRRTKTKLTNYIIHVPKNRFTDIFSMPISQFDATNNDELVDYWHKLRILAKKICPSLEMTKGRSLPSDYYLDQFSSIDWDKGCYIGQEVTARIRYRSKAKKSLLRFKIVSSSVAKDKDKDKDKDKEKDKDINKSTNMTSKLRLIKSGDAIYKSKDPLDKLTVGQVVSISNAESDQTNVIGLMLNSKKFEKQTAFYLNADDYIIEIESF